MTSTEMIIPFRITFLRLRYEKKMYFVELIFAMYASYGKNAEFIFAIPMFNVQFFNLA